MAWRVCPHSGPRNVGAIESNVAINIQTGNQIRKQRETIRKALDGHYSLLGFLLALQHSERKINVMVSLHS